MSSFNMSSSQQVDGQVNAVYARLGGQEFRGAMLGGQPEDADAYEAWQVERHDAVVAAAAAAGELPPQVPPLA